MFQETRWLQMASQVMQSHPTTSYWVQVSYRPTDIQGVGIKLYFLMRSHYRRASRMEALVQTSLENTAIARIWAFNTVYGEWRNEWMNIPEFCLRSQGKILTCKRNEISLYFPVQNPFLSGNYSTSPYLRVRVKSRDAENATEGRREGGKEGGWKILNS